MFLRSIAAALAAALSVSPAMAQQRDPRDGPPDPREGPVDPRQGPTDPKQGPRDETPDEKSAARTSEPAPKRSRGPYLALIFGGGLIDAGALYEAADIKRLASSSIGNLELALRGGWRNDLGLYPIVEGRAALILGTLSGTPATSFSALGGVQWSPWVDALRAPYLNVRAGLRTERGEQGQAHRTAAVALGIELGRGSPFTTLEVSLEPINPWLLTFRVGAVF